MKCMCENKKISAFTFHAFSNFNCICSLQLWQDKIFIAKFKTKYLIDIWFVVAFEYRSKCISIILFYHIILYHILVRKLTLHRKSKVRIPRDIISKMRLHNYFQSCLIVFICKCVLECLRASNMFVLLRLIKLLFFDFLCGFY